MSEPSDPSGRVRILGHEVLASLMKVFTRPWTVAGRADDSWRHRSWSERVGRMGLPLACSGNY